MEESQNWDELVEAAKATVAQADAGNVDAGRTVLVHSAAAIRAVLDRSALPNLREAAYLSAMHIWLVELLDGMEPRRALRLENPWNRPENEDLGVRDAFLFMQVGEEMDRRNCSVSDAIEVVAERNFLGVDTVKKAWNGQGSKSGWEMRKFEGK